LLHKKKRVVEEYLKMPFEKFAVGTEWQVDSVFQVIQDLKKEGIQSISSLLFDSSDEIARD